MTALVKLGLLFASGLSLGLLLPLGRDRPTKPMPLPDDAEPARTPTLTLRCIVEHRHVGGAADTPPGSPSDSSVEVIVRPVAGRQLPMPEEVVVKLRVAADDNSEKAGQPRPARANRPMPRLE